jgi:YbbR domain-containing protein
MSETLHRLFFWVPGIIRRDFLRKAIALAFAVLVWKQVSVQIGIEDTIQNVPVTITAPAGIEILDNDIPRLVDVTVLGSLRRRNPLQASDLKAEIAIQPGQYRGGQHALQLKLRRDDIQSPMGVTVVSIRPEIVTVNLDRRSSRKVPVRCEISGSLMDNYAYGEVKPTPGEVTVSGPEGVLRQFDEIKTSPVILLRENTDNFETEVELIPRRGVEVVPARVHVQIEIYRKYETRNFRGLRVSAMQAEGKAMSKLTVRFTNDKVDISVRGVKDAVHGLSEQALKPFVDVSASGGQPGTYQLPVQAWLGNKDIEVLEIKPSTLEVKVEAR